jgi:hypothetical protein
VYPHPGINFSRLPVEGNAAGLLFVLASVAILVGGLPSLRWFFLGSVAGGVVVAAVLIGWRRYHPDPGPRSRPIVLGLTVHEPRAFLRHVPPAA